MAELADVHGPGLRAVFVSAIALDDESVRCHLDVEVLRFDTGDGGEHLEVVVLLAHFDRGLPEELPLRCQPVVDRVA
jgi:hypothetical protein